MTPTDPLLVVGVLLAVAGALRIVVSAVRADEDRRFALYLLALLLGLVGLGLVFVRTL